MNGGRLKAVCVPRLTHEWSEGPRTSGSAVSFLQGRSSNTVTESTYVTGQSVLKLGKKQSPILYGKYVDAVGGRVHAVTHKLPRLRTHTQHPEKITVSDIRMMEYPSRTPTGVSNHLWINGFGKGGLLVAPLGLPEKLTSGQLRAR